MKKIQQGDVLIYKGVSVPKEAKSLGRFKSFTVAEGEATGHYHELVGDFEMFEVDGGNRYAVLKEDAILTHQEHEDIKSIPAGIYEIGVVVEQNPETKNVEKVRD